MTTSGTESRPYCRTAEEHTVIWLPSAARRFVRKPHCTDATETLTDSPVMALPHPGSHKLDHRLRRPLSVLLLAVAGMCFWRSMPADMADDVRSAAVSRAQATLARPATSPSEPKLLTRPIEEIRVGQRVLAHNPEVSDEERSQWQEPDWSTWQLLQLEMPKPDGSLLKIEMLRPAEWLDSQAALLVESREIIAHPGPPARAEGQGASAEGQTPSPVAKVAKTFGAAGRSSSRASLPLDSNPGNASALSQIEPLPLVPEVLPVGVVAEMDLPELGLTDLAWVTDIADAPEIETGDGRVVTATFHHSSGDVIDLTVEGSGSGRADSQPETIGTTSNHPFWSVDRQEYVQAGQLEPGERVLTFSGDTKRIAGKLPRPGPQPVYNLEVHAEHVYFVGEDGLLVHNSGPVYGQRMSAAQKAVVRGLVDDGYDVRTAIRHVRGQSVRTHDILPYKVGRFTNDLPGHEVLNNMALKARGLVKRRGSGWQSRLNPAIAIPQDVHSSTIQRLQKQYGIWYAKDLAQLSRTTIIRRNLEVLRKVGVTEDAIQQIRRAAVIHARKVGPFSR